MKKLLLSVSMAALVVTTPAFALADDDDDRKRGRQGQNWNRGGDDDDRGRGRNRARFERGDDDDDRRRGARNWRAERDDDDDDDDGRRRWRGSNRDVAAQLWQRQTRAHWKTERDRAKQVRRAIRDSERERRQAHKQWESSERRASLGGYWQPAYHSGSPYRDIGRYRESPLAGLAGILGQIVPAASLGGYNVPSGYQNFYPDSRDYSYRYADGNILQVDRRSNVISSLIPLLGGGFGVGRQLPVGYDAYNVPLQYRDDYYDTPDAYYRYGDNAIYQVDPKTRVIESVVALLAGDNLGIGQMLPGGYDAYNLPLQYRDQYVDNDQYSYRYADGNIYQVDAKTQIIQAIISALI